MSFATSSNIGLDIETIVTQRRFETLTLHNLLQNLCIADCEWLGNSADRRVCQSDALKREELFREFIYWFFDSFLIPLIKVSTLVPTTHAHLSTTVFSLHFTSQKRPPFSISSCTSAMTTGTRSVSPCWINLVARRLNELTRQTCVA